MKISTSATTTLNPLPATFLRGGTSKGIFFNKSSLPLDRAEWKPIFLGVMGSPDREYGRQLDGMGGGVSSLSKIVVVAPPTPEQKSEGIDVEYTFAQIGIRDDTIDYSGNCGNLSSMVGVYAIDEGICAVLPRDCGRATLRAFNTNTQKIIDTTFPITHHGTPRLDLPETTIAGVSGKASKIILDFVNPAGARTGKLLPTGNPTDILDIKHSSVNRQIRVSLIDATNPSVFVDYAQLDEFLPLDNYIAGKIRAIEEVSPFLELVRQEGARKMGLDSSAQAQPKIALLRMPHTPEDSSQLVNIVIYALSMGMLHKAVPMTVGLCLGVASHIKGTIAWSIVHVSSPYVESSDDLVRIRHPGGLVDVGAEFGENGIVESAKVVRTGRRLMKGHVWWH